MGIEPIKSYNDVTKSCVLAELAVTSRGVLLVKLDTTHMSLSTTLNPRCDVGNGSDVFMGIQRALETRQVIEKSGRSLPMVSGRSLS